MGGKRINGRKDHIITDTAGNLLRAWSHPANLPDGEAAWWWLEVVCDAVPTLRCLFADGAYAGPLVDWANAHLNLIIEVVKTLVGQVGFVLLPRRWVVERSLAWLARNRRLVKDYEELPECRESWLYLASIRLLLNRLLPA
jgi:putative transposase